MDENTIKGKDGQLAIIHLDEEPANPREDDNMGRIATVRLSHYRIADKAEDPLPEDLSGWEDVRRYLIRERGAAIILPLYFYDHSVQRLSTRPWIGRAQHAEWDSGQVGFIYATRASVLESFGGKVISARKRGLAARVLSAEVDIYDAYISGSVYGYEIRDKHNNTTGSCWGFYGLKDVEAAAIDAMGGEA